MSDPIQLSLPGPGGAVHVAVRVRPQVINLLLDDSEPSYSFDRSGRLIGAFVASRHYRRGLDNRVLEKQRSAGGGRERRWLPVADAEQFIDGAYALARRVVQESDDGRLSVLTRWDYRALEADASRFADIYGRIGILPPDQYLALVLQATEGCSHNRCTFCDFYRDRAFRIKGPDEFRRHLIAVRDFFGAGLSTRNSLFLADANALVAPMSRVRGWFEVIEEAALLDTTSIYSFIDSFSAVNKPIAEWAELSARGLRRVYIGMETGDPDLLSYLGKPGTIQETVDGVRRLKAGGVGVGVIVMTGIGGDRFAETHVRASARALASMSLGSGDIVYFSPFVERVGSEYSRQVGLDGIRSLNEREVAQQEVQIRSALGKQCASPIYSRYDIREFVY